jgi:hypothetical protein
MLSALSMLKTFCKATTKKPRASLSKNTNPRVRNCAAASLLTPAQPPQPPLPPLNLPSLCLGPCGTPSPPCEGDRGRNGQILPYGPLLSSFSLFFFFCTVLIGNHRAYTSTFLFSFSLFLPSPFLLCSGHVQVAFAGAQRWLVILMGFLFFAGEIKSCCRWCDLQRSWMIRRQRVWDFLPFINLSKLLLVESPKTRIAWHLMPWTIRFDLLSGCTYENWVSSLLSVWTSPTAAALAIYRTVIKPCVFCCFSSCCFYFSIVVISFVVVDVAPLTVGLCTMTYVIFAPLYVGLLGALLYNHHGSLPSRMSGSLPSC